MRSYGHFEHKTHVYWCQFDVNHSRHLTLNRRCIDVGFWHWIDIGNRLEPTSMQWHESILDSTFIQDKSKVCIKPQVYMFNPLPESRNNFWPKAPVQIQCNGWASTTGNHLLFIKIRNKNKSMSIGRIKYSFIFLIFFKNTVCERQYNLITCNRIFFFAIQKSFFCIQTYIILIMHNCKWHSCQTLV